MQRFASLLLDVWREACRHVEIEQFVDIVSGLLQKRMPIRGVLLRRLNMDKLVVETVAGTEAAPQGWAAGFELQTPCSRDQMLGFQRAAEGRRVFRHVAGKGKQGLDAVLPRDFPGEALVGVLGREGRTAGFLFLLAREGESLDDLHAEVLEALIDPFSVALENDDRLRELSALREAAEAERRALLVKLGRQEAGDTIVGADAGLRIVMERVRLVAPSDAPVLIIGETGTGKEVIARSIHMQSSRAANPFLRVNCGAIPPELIDSQLFGHEKGAFTGAVEQRQGWFERADGGSLFLDEIGELPLAAQVRLLRVLQDGWLERVGSHKPVKVNVRIIAATHRDLPALVAEHAFREDLWYRIAVFPILLPPVRERPDDIPALARHLAQRSATRFGLPMVSPTEEDLDLLRAYPWPGNVREMAAVVDRAAILGNGHKLEIAQALGLGLRSLPAEQAPAKVVGREPGGGAPAAGEADTLVLDGVMRAHIETVLRQTHGRVEGPHGAARLLKINPNTLRARMRKLGIRPRTFRIQADGEARHAT